MSTHQFFRTDSLWCFYQGLVIKSMGVGTMPGKLVWQMLREIELNRGPPCGSLVYTAHHYDSQIPAKLELMDSM